MKAKPIKLSAVASKAILTMKQIMHQFLEFLNS